MPLIGSQGLNFWATRYLEKNKGKKEGLSDEVANFMAGSLCSFSYYGFRLEDGRLVNEVLQTMVYCPSHESVYYFTYLMTECGVVIENSRWSNKAMKKAVRGNYVKGHKPSLKGMEIFVRRKRGCGEGS